MVDLTAGLISNLSSVGIVVALQGTASNQTDGAELKEGSPVNVGDKIKTDKDSAVAIRFLQGGGVALGQNQQMTVDKETVERLNKPAEELEKDDPLVVELMAQGASWEEIEAASKTEDGLVALLQKLEGTQAGGDQGAGGDGSSIGVGVRFEYTADQVLPVAGFETTGLGAGGTGAGLFANDDGGFPAPGPVGLDVVEDKNDDGYINIAENSGGINVSVALPDGLLPGYIVVVNGVETVLTAEDIANGSINVTLPLPEEDGVVEITATAYTPTGVAGPSTTTEIIVDLTPPNLTVDSVGPTTDNTPDIVGTGDPGNLVEVYDPNGNLIGTTTVDENGNWSVTPANPIPDPGYQVTVVTTEPSGNTTTVVQDVNVDTTPPGGDDVPLLTIPEAEDGDNVNADEVADGVQVVVTLPNGTAPGDIITLVVTMPDGSTDQVEYTLVEGDGNQVEITIPRDMLPQDPDGEYSVVATIRDPLGNVGNPSAPRPFIVDTSEEVPPKPSISFNEDTNRDGFYNFSENQDNPDGQITVVISLPNDTPVDGKLIVVINGSTRTIALNENIVNSGQVSIDVPALGDGERLVVSAEIETKGGLRGPDANGTLIGDLSDFESPNSGLAISIVTDSNNDGTISLAELGVQGVNGDVDIRIDLPNDAKAGDKLLVTITGQAPRDIIISAADIGEGKINIQVDPLSHGLTLVATAQIVDEAGNISPVVSDSAVMDLLEDQGPGIKFPEDTNGDGSLTDDEIGDDGNVTVEITIPPGTKPGDVLVVDTGDGEQEIPITEEIIDEGKVEIETEAPDNGETLVVDANIKDPDTGEEGPTTTEEVTIDTPDLNTGLAVTINEDRDNNGVINNAELNGADKLTATISLPVGAEQGDTLIYQINGVPAAAPISAADIDAGEITINLPLPENGQRVEVIAQVEDPAGNSSNQASDNATMNFAVAPDTPAIRFPEDSDGNGVLNRTEADGLSDVDVQIILPSELAAGDQIVYSFNGGVTETVTLSQAQIDVGSITVDGPLPANGETLRVEAYGINDGSIGPSANGELAVDTSDLSNGLAIAITEDADNDGVISAAELDGLIDVEISLGPDAAAGDRLSVNASGANPQVIILSDEHIAAGKIELSYQPPANGGRFDIEATLSDAAGNSSDPVSDSALMDIAVAAAPAVLFPADSDPKDGYLNSDELDAITQLDAEVTIPTGVEAGDTLVYTVNGGDPVEVTVTQAHINNGKVAVVLDKPSDGDVVSVDAHYVDQNGNVGKPGNGTLNVDASNLSDGLAVEIREDANNDGIISLAEQQGSVDVRVSLPAGAKAGDSLTVTASANTPVVMTITQEAIDNGFIDLAFNSVSQGNDFNVEAVVSDIAGNTSEPATDTARVADDGAAPAPGVRIVTDANDDGVITAKELEGQPDQVDIEVTLPANTEVGDRINLSTNNGDSFSHTVSAVDLAKGSVSFEVDRLDNGQTLEATATITHSGETGASASDSALFNVDPMPPKPGIRFVEDTNRDGFYNFEENKANTDGQLDVRIDIPAETLVDSILTVTIDDETTQIVVTQELLDAGFVTLN
ncbi:MAG: Ig-like domain-containing protein, partial [Cellvibrionaceae bacterium]|nr:Ig-like domain-containing protein [Cellvibrionaceae bacterium]